MSANPSPLKRIVGIDAGGTGSTAVLYDGETVLASVTGGCGQPEAIGILRLW